MFTSSNWDVPGRRPLSTSLGVVDIFIDGLTVAKAHICIGRGSFMLPASLPATLNVVTFRIARRMVLRH